MPSPRTSRNGRGRAAGDPFRDALAAALADALDVDAAALEVRVLLDGSPVDAARLPLEIVLESPAATSPAPRGSGGSEPAAVDADADEAESDGPEEREPAARGTRGSGAGAERAERGGRTGGGAPARQERARQPESPESVPVTPEELDEEAEAAADLLEGLLDALELPGDLRISVRDAHAEVEIVGLGEGVLIGRRGQTLEAVQELVRTAMQRRFERRSRVLVDVDGYRARRLERLIERAEEAIQEVLDSGESQRLEPMDSIERRLVHQRVAAFAGVTSVSHGREPARRIVIEPSED
jgi:spoIIIJ-associated protein